MLGEAQARKQAVRYALHHRPVHGILGGEAQSDVVRGLLGARGLQGGGVHEAHGEFRIIRGQVARRGPRDRVLLDAVLLLQDVRDQRAKALALIGNADHRGSEASWGVSMRRTTAKSSARAASRLAASSTAPVSRVVVASLASVVPQRPSARISGALPTAEWPVGSASSDALRTKAAGFLPDARAASTIASHSAAVYAMCQSGARRCRVVSLAAG